MRQVLRRLQAGELNLEEAEAELRQVQLTELGGRARLDVGRTARRGLPEVVLGAGKTPDEVARLTVALARAQGQGLASRLGDDQAAAIEAAAGDAGLDVLRYGKAARLVHPEFRVETDAGRVGLISAGTSDLDVVDEARMVLDACGAETRVEADIGVAGLHRLLAPLAALLAWDPDVLIVAAGMDGVLPGVVSGLVEVPVIGLPVATGYGAGGGGEAALLTMLQSCATGLLVVNIGNGVGAGAAAVLIGRRAAGRRRRPRPRAPRRQAPRSQ